GRASRNIDSCLYSYFDFNATSGCYSLHFSLHLPYLPNNSSAAIGVPVLISAPPPVMTRGAGASSINSKTATTTRPRPARTYFMVFLPGGPSETAAAVAAGAWLAAAIIAAVFEKAQIRAII